MEGLYILQNKNLKKIFSKAKYTTQIAKTKTDCKNISTTLIPVIEKELSQINENRQ